MMSNDTISSRLEIEMDEEGIIIYANVLSADEACEYSEQCLEQKLAEQGCKGLTIIKTAHEKIADFLSKNKSGKVKLGQKVDGKVEAIVSGDLLTASLRITAAKGGRHVGTRDVVAALNDKEIDLMLVNKKRIIGLVKKAEVIAPGTTIDVVVAKGTAPVHGKDTQFKCLLDDITDRKPHLRDDGTLDYYDLGELACIEAGTHLMRMYPPTVAKNGTGVTGEEIPARIGKKLKFNKCKGAEVSPDDPALLVASIKGQPIIVVGGVNVEDLYTVKNVGLHTGHIKYDGSVVVKGDVASGMKIDVTGDVQVYGMVENASIEAGGNIDIKLGAVGRADDPNGKSGVLISCAGNLSAGYLENATVDVKGDILVKSRISNCEVKAGYQVVVGNRLQEKSGIVGGHVSASSTIRAEVLGSTGRTLTRVSITSDDILKRLEAIKKEIVKHNEILVTKLGSMVGLSKKKTEESKIELQKVKQETEEFKEVVNDLIVQQQEIEASLEQVKQGKIIAQKEAHPGVTIKILDQEMSIKSVYGKGAFVLKEDFIAFENEVSK